MAIREQVNEMERSVAKIETLTLIRNDLKERLKVNEILMSLLFKLDSVRGVDLCVRNLRKFVIKKAIALQEMVDAIISSDQSVDSNNAEAVDQSQDIILSQIKGNENETLETSGKENQIDSFVNHENAVEEEDVNEKEESGRKEMLETIVEDNEKTMRLMEALSERNEMQSRMLCTLS
ncbi:hypothetical protein V6N11_040139 [Hibiscus sabdariffa]|uniref:BAG domain-containing protein n=1 Tax=Hibiscus sabdariffa TaxID=183260 RepID=A0ABR2RH05_9ROSI